MGRPKGSKNKPRYDEYGDAVPTRVTRRAAAGRRDVTQDVVELGAYDGLSLDDRLLSQELEDMALRGARVVTDG
jgi:hypothetical protein